MSPAPKRGRPSNAPSLPNWRSSPPLRPADEADRGPAPAESAVCLPRLLVFPILPLDAARFEITRNRHSDGWEEELLTKLCEQAKSLQLVLHRILQFGKTQLDPLRMQCLIQFGNHVAGGDVHAGHRLRCNDQPAYGCRRCRHGVQHALLEEFGIGKEQRRIPPEQNEPGDPARIGISRNVVIAFDAAGAAQYGGMRAPAVP